MMERIVRIVASFKARRIDRILSRPAEHSEHLLRELLRQNAGTVFGRKHGFASIRTPEQYSERVPLRTYDDMEPYLRAVYQRPAGGILTNDPVYWYYISSGTSGHEKNLPVTRRGMAQVAEGGSAMYMKYVDARPEHARIFSGKMVMLGASAIRGYINGVPKGYASGVGVLHLNRILRRCIVPGMDILNIEDMHEKMWALARLTACLDVTAFMGISPLVLAFLKKMQQDFALKLAKVLPAPHAERIRRAILGDGTLDLHQLWPGMQLLVASGVDPDPYRKWLESMFPEMFLLEVYASSEGFYGSQFYDEPGVKIFPHLNWIELIPVEHIDDPEPETIPLSDAKKNFRYEVVVTNVNGWYRYRLGDLVTVVDTDPITVDDISRRGLVVNLSGEKLSDMHVRQALTEATMKTNISVADYTVVAVKDRDPPFYALLVVTPSEGDLGELQAAFEEALYRSNNEFRVVREMGAVGPTRVLRVPALTETKVEDTHPQAKVQPLTLDPSEIRGLQEYLEGL